jgi:hypothetical protein
MNTIAGVHKHGTMAQDLKHPAKPVLRKWLSANGVPSTYSRNLGFADLERAWNDRSDITLQAMREILDSPRGLLAGVIEPPQHPHDEGLVLRNFPAARSCGRLAA